MSARAAAASTKVRGCAGGLQPERGPGRAGGGGERPRSARGRAGEAVPLPFCLGPPRGGSGPGSAAEGRRRAALRGQPGCRRRRCRLRVCALPCPACLPACLHRPRDAQQVGSWPWDGRVARGPAGVEGVERGAGSRRAHRPQSAAWALPACWRAGIGAWSSDSLHIMLQTADIV